MGVPEVRARLFELAKGRGEAVMVERAELRKLAEELYREPAITRAPIRSTKMTANVRAEIRTMHRLHPRMTQHEIAAKLNISQGRVSETLNGKHRIKREHL